jgi:hypothetical protein
MELDLTSDDATSHELTDTWAALERQWSTNRKGERRMALPSVLDDLVAYYFLKLK